MSGARSPGGSTDDAAVLVAAQRACTPKQLEALRLYAAGYGRKRMARILGITPQAAAARLEGARVAVRRELERDA